MKKTLFTMTLLMTCTALAKPTVLIATKEKGDFKALYDNLNSELSSRYQIKSINLDKDVTYASFEKDVKANKPELMILMDNQAVTLAQEFYSKNETVKFQSVAVMGLNYKTLLKGNKHICGIAYEVPAFTLLTQFRFTRADKKLKKVLTFYRGSQFEETVSEAKGLASKEGIEIIAIDVDKKEDALTYLKSDGRKEVDSGKYDAVYVILDSVLLEKKNFSEFWLPTAKASKTPFVVGAEKLASPAFEFAVFGMSPNIPDLASQTVQVVESVLEDKEPCTRVEDLIGVTRFWNEKKGDAIGVKINEEVKSETNVLK